MFVVEVLANVAVYGSQLLVTVSRKPGLILLESTCITMCAVSSVIKHALELAAASVTVYVPPAVNVCVALNVVTVGLPSPKFQTKVRPLVVVL
jgi:hypothetical protein